MKKIKYLLIGTLLIGAINFSCKKNADTKPQAIKVGYQITPEVLPYLIQMSYDSSGTEVTTQAPSQFSQFVNGKIFNFYTKPFTAHIGVMVNNTTAATITYNVAIEVDGAVKQLQQCSAFPETISNAGASFDVQ